MEKQSKTHPKGRASKLEIYLRVLRLFAGAKPMYIEEAQAISNKCYSQEELTSIVDFLVEQHLIKKFEQQKQDELIITLKGIRILNYFKLEIFTFGF